MSRGKNGIRTGGALFFSADDHKSRLHLVAAFNRIKRLDVFELSKELNRRRKRSR